MTETQTIDAPTTALAYSVVIADDDDKLRKALGDLLNVHPALNVVGSVNNGQDAALICDRLEPHIAVLDVMMKCGGLAGLAAVKAASPDTVVVFFTAQAGRRTCKKLMDAGAAAVFSKGAPIDLSAELLAVIVAHEKQDQI